jgi:D-alanine-D-alanine ligase
MRICILDPSYAGSTSTFLDYDAASDPTPFLAGYEVERADIRKAPAVRQVRELAARGFDVFLNLCDGARDEDRAGIEVVETLERLGLAFTGAGSSFFEPSRAAIKLACFYAGVATPRGVTLADAGELDAVAGLRFPLIVKHPSSYGSIGLTRGSRVEDRARLRAEVDRMVGSFGGALVEEYIAGREFTVLVAERRDEAGEPLALVPVEYHFPPGESFKHFDLKWIDFPAEAWRPVGDERLADRLAATVRRVFTSLGGSGYARCDLRLAADGELFLLDVNPNCGLFYPPDAEGSADIILAHDPLGPRGFLDHAFDCALRRRRRDASRLAPPRGPGEGPSAAIAFAPGEVIARLEERPQRLVSLGHVDRTWSPGRQRWFRRHSHPVGEEVYAIWEREGGGWPILPHACDPSGWLDGLDLVARRAIAQGEAVTVDHATFRGGAMAEIDCACGAPDCRRRVTADDHLAAWLEDRYGKHLSAWVRSRRAGRA